MSEVFHPGPKFFRRLLVYSPWHDTIQRISSLCWGGNPTILEIRKLALEFWGSRNKTERLNTVKNIMYNHVLDQNLQTQEAVNTYN